MKDIIKVTTEKYPDGSTIKHYDGICRITEWQERHGEVYIPRAVPHTRWEKFKYLLKQLLP